MKTDSPENPEQTSDGARGSGEKLSDTEVIATWMEPKPELPNRYSHLMPSPKGWWVLGPINAGGMRWFPLQLDLGALWEVEERLLTRGSGLLALARSAELVGPYNHQLQQAAWPWHADAPTRIRALAAVLRPIVEAAIQERLRTNVNHRPVLPEPS